MQLVMIVLRFGAFSLLLALVWAIDVRCAPTAPSVYTGLNNIYEYSKGNNYCRGGGAKLSRTCCATICTPGTLN